MGKNTVKMKAMIKELPRWNKPSAGKSLTLREWLMYTIGGCGAMGATVFLTFFTMMHGFYIAAAVGISVDVITIIGVVTSVVTIVSSPLVSWMIDNTNTKYGKFRPYLIVLPIPILLCFIALGQVVRIPDATAMIIVYAILFNIVAFFNRIYLLAFTSLSQVMAPSMDERTQLMSIGTFFTSLGPTLVWMIYPTVSNWLYSVPAADNGGTEIAGINTVATAQVLVPIIASVFFALGLIMAFGVKERMVISKQHKQKQKFTDGVVKVSKNKYFWLHNTSAIFLVTKLLVSGTFVVWFTTYVIGPELNAMGHTEIAGMMQSIAMTLIGDAVVPGMLLAPYIIRKFGKKKILLVTNLGMAASMLPLIFVRNAWVGLVFIYLFTLFSGLQVVATPACQAEIYDYQQYKTGDRLEGFLSQFGAMIALTVGIGTAFIAPAIFKHYGYIDNADVLFDNEILFNILGALAIISCISCALSAIPFFFWDLTEKRHKDIMEVLKIRALHDEGTIDDETRDMLVLEAEAGNSDALSNYIEANNISIDNDSITLNKGVSALLDISDAANDCTGEDMPAGINNNNIMEEFVELGEIVDPAELDNDKALDDIDDVDVTTSEDSEVDNIDDIEQLTSTEEDLSLVTDYDDNDLDIKIDSDTKLD